MSAYDDRKNSLSREPVTLVVLTLDWCNNTFGLAPCTATGEPCYKVWATCKDRANYSRGTKDYKYTDRAALHGARPYVRRIKENPTKISDKMTPPARLRIELADEPESDVGMDPYVTQRSAFPNIPGTHAGRLVARNPNYRGRPVKVYKGFMGLDEAEYALAAEARVVKIVLNQGGWAVETEDLLAGLDTFEVPEKINCELVAAITDTDTEATLSDVSKIDDAGYVLIGEELIKYTAKNPVTKQITGFTRGAEDTTAAAHSANEKVGKVRHYSGNGFDILKEMLTVDAGYSTSSIDTTAFDTYKQSPEVDVSFSAFITKPTKLRKLYFEVVELLNCFSWQNESGKITIRRDLPNEPDRAYEYISDQANVIHGSPGVDLNDKSRITRYSLYWDGAVLGDEDDEKSYSRVDVAMDADAESENDLGKAVEEKVFCRWLRQGSATEEELALWAALHVGRRLLARNYAQVEVSLKLELKDEDVLTGDGVMLSTSALVNPDGTDIYKGRFYVRERERMGIQEIRLKLRRLSPYRVLYMAPDSAPDYDSATEEEREKYGYMCDDTGYMPDGTPGYVMY